MNGLLDESARLLNVVLGIDEGVQQQPLGGEPPGIAVEMDYGVVTFREEPNPANRQEQVGSPHRDGHLRRY